MLPESFISQLKFSCDIEQILSPYVRLTRKGKNLVGLCPFHGEKTPSFFVYPDNQSFYCFGCGVGGDVISFVMTAENLEYIDAVRLLAQKSGVPLPEEDGESRGEARLKTRVLEMNRLSARFYYDNLLNPQGTRGLQYLLDRGLSRNTIRKFGLGYAPESWDGVINHLTAKGYNMEEMAAAGIAVQGNKSFYDRFRGRVMFPIIDIRGNVIAFGGRALEDKGPKYLNSADTPVFKKSRNLFALSFAKNTKRESLLLCEGYMDVISLHQGGFDNAVATLGTSLTEEQVLLLAKYTEKVILAYDSDGAGQAATKRAIQIFSKVGIKVHVLNITGAKDPDEYIKAFGKERFEMLLDGSTNALEFQINRLRRQYNLDSDDGKINFLKDFCQLLSEVPNPIEREVYLSKIAAELDVAKQAVEQQVQKIFKSKLRTQQKKEQRDTKIYIGELPNLKNDPERARHLQSAIAQERLLGALPKNPDYFERVQKHLSAEDFSVESNRKIYEALVRRLEAHQGLELIHLSGELDSDLMGKLAGFVANMSQYNPSPKEIDDYISIIKTHRDEKTTQEVAQMSNEQFMENFRAIAAKKKT